MFDGHYTVKGQVEIRIHVLGRCSHPFEVRKRTSGPPRDCDGTAVESQQSIETEEMLLLRGLHRLFGSRHRACQAWKWTKLAAAICELQHPTNVTEIKSFRVL